MKSAKDEELVGQVAQGSEQALAELYDRYSRPAYATGIRLLGDAQLAEDLVQDAFNNLLMAAAAFDQRRTSFATWFYQRTHNRAMELSHKRRSEPHPASAVPPREISGSQEPVASSDSWDVARALSSVPAEHREVLTMAYFEGLSLHEISQRTGIPLGTIKSQTTAALKSVHRRLVDPAAEEARRG